MTGFVYFIQAGDDGPIKIGYTAGNPRSRLSALQTGNAEPLRLLAFLRGALSDEAELHLRFDHLRMMGEWFRPGSDLLDHVRGVAPAQVPEAADEGDGGRIECGLGLLDLHDIADFVESRQLHAAAYRLARAVERMPGLPPIKVAERLESLAESIQGLYCNGGAGVAVFGRESLRDRGRELLNLAEWIRNGHNVKEEAQ